MKLVRIWLQHTPDIQFDSLSQFYHDIKGRVGAAAFDLRYIGGSASGLISQLALSHAEMEASLFEPAPKELGYGQFDVISFNDLGHKTALSNVSARAHR